MARGGFCQRRQPRSARTFLHPRASGQGKAQAFRRNPGVGEQPQNMIRLGPAFRAQPMIRDQGHHPPAPRRHPIPRQQGSRQAMRPA